MVHLQQVRNGYYQYTIKLGITADLRYPELEDFVKLITYSPGFFSNAQTIIPKLRNRHGNNQHADPAVQRLLEATNRLCLPPIFSGTAPHIAQQE